MGHACPVRSPGLDRCPQGPGRPGQAAPGTLVPDSAPARANPPVRLARVLPAGVLRARGPEHPVLRGGARPASHDPARTDPHRARAPSGGRRLLAVCRRTAPPAAPAAPQRAPTPAELRLHDTPPPVLRARTPRRP